MRLSATTAGMWAITVWSGSALDLSAMKQVTAPSDCISIGKPAPSKTYTYDLVDSLGKRTQFTESWEEVTVTGSRVRTTRGGGAVIQVNEHRVIDDVTVLDRTSRRNANGGIVDSTAFRPGIVLDPAFRACAGRSWPIPSVTANYESPQNRASSATPAGTLRIVALHDPVSVPAGTFDAVRYVRTSQSNDEYWKSIEHGVIVKHIGTLPNAVVTETLVSIK